MLKRYHLEVDPIGWTLDRVSLLSNIAFRLA